MLERKDPTSWLKSVSAFANTQGGTLLFGVANDGALVGLADAQGDAEFISETIKMQMDPVPKIDLSLHEEDGKRFVVVAIKAGSETPYYTFVKYPERAYEECIVNGLIHRDYCEIGSEVHIDIFDDRMEISSPGGMPSGDLVQQLDWMNVTSIRRNPVIADLFQRLDLMERRGSGFKKVLDAYAFESEKRGVSIRPEFRSARSAFFAVLPNLNYGHSIGQVTGHVAGQATGQVTGHVVNDAAGHVDEDSILVLQEIANVLPGNAARLLRILKSEMDIHQILTKIRFSSRAHLRKSALYPALEMGLVEMTQPNSPRSPTQKYRLTGKGKAVSKMLKGGRK